MAMRLLDIRIEGNIKTFIEQLARAGGWTINDTVRDLILIGLDVNRQGGIEITGPLGLKRSFAYLDFGGGRERIGVRLPQELIDELKRDFDDTARSAAKKALRLGVIALRADLIEIRGPVFDFRRPLAQTRVPSLRDERAKEALKRLQTAISQ